MTTKTELADRITALENEVRALRELIRQIKSTQSDVTPSPGPAPWVLPGPRWDQRPTITVFTPNPDTVLVN